jgi:hypothetical protein
MDAGERGHVTSPSSTDKATGIVEVTRIRWNLVSAERVLSDLTRTIQNHPLLESRCHLALASARTSKE